MRISLLSTIDGFFLGYIINSLMKHKVEIHSILLDSKTLGEHDKTIFHQRTGGKMPFIDLSTFEKQKLPFYFFSSHLSSPFIQFIEDNDIDLLVEAGTPRILTPDVLNAPKIGVLNWHPGLLPDYRGCSCVEWALYNNDPVGNTIFLMTEEIDRGPILKKEAIDIKEDDTYQDIRNKVFMQGSDLLARTVKSLQMGDITEKDYEEATEGTYYKAMPDEKFQELMQRFPSSS